MKIRPLNDLVLIRMEPLRAKFHDLFLVHGERVRYGVVLATGPGRYIKDSAERAPTGVQPGDRVVFFREHLEHLNGKAVLQVLAELGDDLGLLKAPDILLVDEDGTVEITA